MQLTIRFLQVITCMIVTLAVHAQSLEVINASGADISGDTIFVEVDYTNYDVQVYAGLENVGNSSLNVNVTRYETDVLPSTSSYFCWGSCTGVTASGSHPIVTPGGSVGMSSGQIIPCSNQGFTLYYDPNFQIGTSLFRIKFFDVNAPSDSTHVYISITSMDMASVAEVETEMLVYPNPVNDQVIVEGISGVYQFYLTNAVGQLIHAGDLKNDDVINVANLQEGLYFLHLEIGEMVKTKSIRIQR